ncbi:MAG: hypothetical protein J2P45_30635 [Candidatus Dormibacteraeota bacterium]|nr:hypothetical protein [Candidatus Dormibacteraeota bacterium]
MSQRGGGPPGYTFSPDGRWWWDGRRWQPVQVAPAAPGRRGVPRWLIAAIVAVGLLVAAAPAVAAAVIANLSAHLPPPSPPPGHYLAATSEGRIEQAATAQGLRCGSPQSIRFGPAPESRDCERGSATGVVSVQTTFFDARHVVAINADAVGQESASVAFLQSIIDATLPAGDAATADAWLRGHFDQSGTSSTVVNGVGLRLVASGPSRMLVITPASDPGGMG